MGRIIWRWLNLPFVFPFVVVVAAFVYLIERYKSVLKAAVVLEYLKVLSLPAILAIIAIIVLYILVRYREAQTALVQFLVDRAATRELIDAGVTMNLTSTQFVRVAELYTKMRDENLITTDEHRKWAVFHAHFKKAFPQATEFWRAAVQAKGPTGPKVRKRVSQEFDELCSTLAKFEIEAYERLAKL